MSAVAPENQPIIAATGNPDFKPQHYTSTSYHSTTTRSVSFDLDDDDRDPDPQLTSILRTFRTPLTVWVVGYNAVTLLPNALPDPIAILGYLPGPAVRFLAKGELAYEGLFVLSGIAAGTALIRATPKGKQFPPLNATLKFYLQHLIQIIPAAWSAVSVLIVADLPGFGRKKADAANAAGDALLLTNVSRRYSKSRESRFGHFWAVALDWQFYLIAPWVFGALKTADRGAGPRNVILVSALAAGAKYLLDQKYGVPALPGDAAVTLAHLPWLHVPDANFNDQIFFRAPAFLAGLALALERSRKGHPSTRNLAIGAAVSVGLWGALLFAPASALGGPTYAAARAALRLPVTTVATYFALRPFVAYPPEEVFQVEWRKRIQDVITHPHLQSAATVSLTAYLIHKDVIQGVYRIARHYNWLAGGVKDSTVIGLWLGAVAASGVGAAVIYQVLEAPALRFFKRLLHNKAKLG
ncbi:hypothetical protein HK104_010492 [Borealophlyctis nickersoniae]|nr:hypothetical protein HK104_010492 [Borealophlyctis nickersoniae]